MTNGAGRPEKPIDWNKVDELLEAGCHGTEICPHFDLTPDRFYDRVQEKYGINFTQYSQQKRQKGDSSLKQKQFEKAINGDNVMLVWLGKNRLNQRESGLAEISSPNEDKLKLEDENLRLKSELEKLKNAAKS